MDAPVSLLYLSQAGLSTLFSALKLYDTDFHSLGLHFSPFCKVHPDWETFYNILKDRDPNGNQILLCTI